MPIKRKKLDARIDKILAYSGEYDKYKGDAVSLFMAYLNTNRMHLENIDKSVSYLPVDNAAKLLGVSTRRIRFARKLLHELKMIKTVHWQGEDKLVRNYIQTL